MIFLMVLMIVEIFKAVAMTILGIMLLDSGIGLGEEGRRAAWGSKAALQLLVVERESSFTAAGLGRGRRAASQRIWKGRHLQSGGGALHREDWGTGVDTEHGFHEHDNCYEDFDAALAATTITLLMMIVLIKKTG